MKKLSDQYIFLNYYTHLYYDFFYFSSYPTLLLMRKLELSYKAAERLHQTSL